MRFWLTRDSISGELGDVEVWAGEPTRHEAGAFVEWCGDGAHSIDIISVDKCSEWFDMLPDDKCIEVRATGWERV